MSQQLWSAWIHVSYNKFQWLQFFWQKTELNSQYSPHGHSHFLQNMAYAKLQLGALRGHFAQCFTIFALQYLRNVFVCFFPLLLYLPLDANNPHGTCPSCLHDHKGKKNTRSETHRQCKSSLKGQGKTNSEEGKCGQLLLQCINQFEWLWFHGVYQKLRSMESNLETRDRT